LNLPRPGVARRRDRTATSARLSRRDILVLSA